MITVKQLIKFLQKQPQDLPVAYAMYSEYDLLELESIGIIKLQAPRPDGWIHDSWNNENLKTVEYLVFPGN